MTRPNDPAARELRRIRRKNLLALAGGILVACLVAELGTRVYFALQTGPRILLYGSAWHRNVVPDEHAERWRRTRETREYRAAMASHQKAEDRVDSVEQHRADHGGYSKFFPNEIKTTRDVDTGERIPVTISRHGFRGGDFSLEKSPGVVRVLTLGASSTFGYYNRDHETYPFKLQEALNRRAAPGRRFEVVNLAIPHAKSAHVTALFLSEGLALDPDVVTFYQGRNDSTLRRPYDGFVAKAYSVLVHRILLVAFIDHVMIGERLSLTAVAERFEPHAAALSERYLSHLTAILEACRTRGILFVVANQQATSSLPFPQPEAQRLARRGWTFEAEAEAIRAKIRAGREIDLYEFSFIVHERLMRDLEAWAARHDVSFVDVIAALDEDRHDLLSWVHLHPRANERIADLFAEAIRAER